MHFAYSPCNPNVFFTIILNRKNNDSSLQDYLMNLLGEKLYQEVEDCLFKDEGKLKLNFERNTQIITRINTPGGDLCSHVEFLKSDFWLSNGSLFKYFFFINSSVRGPFLPRYYLKKWQVFHFNTKIDYKIDLNFH
jgi:hypothetical protein